MARSVPILMYHSISDHVSSKFKAFTVSPKLFAEHMAYLAEHNYTTITVTQFINAINGDAEELPEKPIILTFDDGFADFYTNVFPVLKSYGFTATLYIVTAFTGGTSRWLKDEQDAARPLLNWEQLAEISAGGIECGAHSHSHAQLDILPSDMAREEIKSCKQILEKQLSQSITSIAYPYGYHSDTVKQIVRSVGYTSACAVKYKMSSTDDDPFALSRLMVAVDTHIDKFAALLTNHMSLQTTYLQVRAKTWSFIRRMGLRFKGSLL